MGGHSYRNKTKGIIVSLTASLLGDRLCRHPYHHRFRPDHVHLGLQELSRPDLESTQQMLQNGNVSVLVAAC